MLEFSIVTISVFVSTLNEITKALVKGIFKKEINKFIPLFSIAYGIGLAIIAFYTGIENFGNNLVEAMFIGLSSGAAATGYHQVGKQLFKETVTTEQKEEKVDVKPTNDEISALIAEIDETINEISEPIDDDVKVEDVAIEEDPSVEDVSAEEESKEVETILGTEDNIISDYTEGE